MLKSNITNLQFILDNKPQYSISFDKQQEKYMFLGILVFRFGVAEKPKPNRTTELHRTGNRNRTEKPNFRLFGSVSIRFGSVFGFR